MFISPFLHGLISALQGGQRQAPFSHNFFFCEFNDHTSFIRHTSRMGVISVDWTVTLTSVCSFIFLVCLMSGFKIRSFFFLHMLVFFAISLSLMWLLTGHWLLLDC